MSPTIVTRTPWRRALLTILAAVLVLGVLLAQQASAQAARPKPTVVLVHGAWADGSGWNAVTQRLQRAGYQVMAPANPLRTLSGDSAYIASVLASIKGPIVLAAHSYGGAVITNAARGNPNVKALVYIAGFAPDQGETTLGLLARFPGSQVAPALVPVPFTQPDGSTGTDLYINPRSFRRIFTGMTVPARAAAAMAAAQRPAAAATGAQPSGAPAWATIPSWDLIARNDLVIPPALQRFMANRMHAHTTTVRSSHLIPVVQPRAVARIIVRAARAVR